MKYEAKKNIVIQIGEAIRNTESPIAEVIAEMGLVSVNSFYKWIRTDNELKQLYERAKTEAAANYKDKIVDLAKKQIYKKVEQGSIRAIEYVLNNLSMEFNPDVREIRKIIFSQLIQALTNTNLTQTQFETIVDRMKQIELGMPTDITETLQIEA